jgi:hypothetical protein
MIYLKATSKEQFDQAMADAGWTKDIVDHEGNTFSVPVSYTESRSLDIIGIIQKETGEMQYAEGPLGRPVHIPVRQTLEGYHANLILHGEELPDVFSSMVIDAPATPNRAFL